MAKPIYVIFNTICCDGLGDFVHFEKIMNALLLNPAFKDVEFISIVYFESGGKESNYIRVRNKIKSLDFFCLFGKADELYIDTRLKEKLSEAKQAIIISYDRTLFPKYAKYLNKNIPIKYISEHENSSLPIWVGADTDRYIDNRSFGLSETCYGIIMGDANYQVPLEAWNTINQNDALISDALLASTNSSCFEDLIQRNIIIPAYFNKDEDFFTFINFFISMDNFSKDRDIVIYHSGTDLSKFLSDGDELSKILSKTDVICLEIYQPDKNTKISIGGNPHGTRSVKILSGFPSSDLTYSAIYNLEHKIAGVSGDSTLERCISMDILPWYWSYNSTCKRRTFDALQVITQSQDINISQEARASFNVYFHAGLFYGLFHPFTPDADDPGARKLINLKEMIKHWPTITRYLKQNRYYDLEGVILEKLTPQSRVVPNNKERDDINYQAGSYKLTTQQFFHAKQESEKSTQDISINKTNKK